MLFLSILMFIIAGVLSIFDLCLLVRAICSWVPSFRDSIIYNFTYTITEPILSPIRNLLMRFEWIRNFPLDLSFLVVFLLNNVFLSFFQNLAYTFLYM